MILPENGKLIKDPITIAAIMNDYFTDMTRTVGRKGPQSNHETIVLIGTKHVKKIPCYIIATQFAGGILLKELYYFELMLNIFELPRVKRIVKFDRTMQICFRVSLDRIS